MSVTKKDSKFNLPQDRPLTREERAFAEHVLRNCGVPEAPLFVTQLDHVRVTGKCSCGCPTIDLTVPTEFRTANPPKERILVDATGRADGKLMGILVFQADGLLTLLEGYRLESVGDEPFNFPPLETVERTEWIEMREPGKSLQWRKAAPRKADKQEPGR